MKNSFENNSCSANQAPAKLMEVHLLPKGTMVDPFFFEDDECPVISMQAQLVSTEQSTQSPQKKGRDAQISQMLRNFTLHQHTQSTQKIRGGNLSPTPSVSLVPVLKKSTPTKQQSPKGGSKNSSGKKKRHHSYQITVSDFDHHSANGPEPALRGRHIDSSRKKIHQNSGSNKKKPVLIIKREFIKKQDEATTIP